MADVQLILPGTLVKKSNSLIRTRISVNDVVSGRILATMIACIKMEDQEVSKNYEVNAKNFLEEKDGGNGYTRIKNYVRSMASAFAELETPDPKGKKEPKFQAIPFFSSITYESGIIYGKFNDIIFPLLVKLKENFTKYNLIEYLKLPSMYSQRMFEIIKSYENLSKNGFEINLDYLQKLLNCPEFMKKNFKEFRTRVLEKSELDINKRTTLKFNWEPVKTGRKVTSIRFIFANCKIDKPKRMPIDATKEANEKIIQGQQASFLKGYERFHRAREGI